MNAILVESNLFLGSLPVKTGHEIGLHQNGNSDHLLSNWPAIVLALRVCLSDRPCADILLRFSISIWRMRRHRCMNSAVFGIGLNSSLGRVLRFPRESQPKK